MKRVSKILGGAAGGTTKDSQTTTDEAIMTEEAEVVLGHNDQQKKQKQKQKQKKKGLKKIVQNVVQHSMNKSMSILNMTRHHPQHSNHHTSSSDSNYQRRRRRPSVSNDGRDAARFTKEEQKMRPIGVGAGQVLVQEKGKVMPVMPVAVTVAAELPTLENLLATSTNINVNNYSNEMLPIHSNSNGNGNAHGNSKRRLYANKSVGEPTNLTKRLNEARVEAQFTHVYKY